MHRRFLFPLVAGILGVVGVSPALISEPLTPAVGAAPAKTTTSSTAPDPASDSDPDRADEPGTAPGGDSGGDSGTDSDPGSSDSGGDSGSGSGSGGPSSSTNCDPPVTDRGPAPQVGEAAQTHEAGEAGTVDVERLSDSELRIAGASPNDGWTEEVRVPSGPRVNVRFTRQGQSPSLVRFAASMDQKGTEIHIRVTSCG